MRVGTSTLEQFSTRTELLAIVFILDKFRVYVFGHYFFNLETIKKKLPHTCNSTGSNRHNDHGPPWTIFRPL
jgi:hypothetical protein